MLKKNHLLKSKYEIIRDCQTKINFVAKYIEHPISATSNKIYSFFNSESSFSFKCIENIIKIKVFCKIVLSYALGPSVCLKICLFYLIFILLIVKNFKILYEILFKDSEVIIKENNNRFRKFKRNFKVIFNFHFMGVTETLSSRVQQLPLRRH